jgi:hypothetical protein
VKEVKNSTPYHELIIENKTSVADVHFPINRKHNGNEISSIIFEDFEFNLCNKYHGNSDLK